MNSAFGSCPLVFVVDDEIEISRMLAVILQMNLFDAVSFTDPGMALEAAKERTPDLLISDIVMPGMSGIDLAIAIRGQVPTCKVLLFSGHPEARELIKQAKAQGNDFAFLQKPVRPPTLVESLRNL